MKRLVLLPLFFLLANCFFAVDWSKVGSPREKDKAVLEETPEVQDTNLSKSQLLRKGKPGTKAKGDSEPFDLMTGQEGNSSTTRNCSLLYSNCKDKCWKEYPIPAVETVFTAVTVDRKRWDCIGQCSNVCGNFDPQSSGGSMPNSGKGNYSNPNAPRY